MRRAGEVLMVIGVVSFILHVMTGLSMMGLDRAGVISAPTVPGFIWVWFVVSVWIGALGVLLYWFSTWRRA